MVAPVKEGRMSTAKSSGVLVTRARGRKRSRTPGHAARLRFVAICLTPIMVLFFVFSFLPIGMSIVLSLYRYSPLDMNAPFIGLRNYTFAVTKDLAFRKSIGNTLLYVIL